MHTRGMPTHQLIYNRTQRSTALFAVIHQQTGVEILAELLAAMAKPQRILHQGANMLFISTDSGHGLQLMGNND
jgi:hypothetical protein